MARAARRPELLPYAAAGTLLLLLFLGERVLAGLVAERRAIGESASNILLYDAEILARSLDGLLRVADLSIQNEERVLAGVEASAAQPVLAAIAGMIPECQNAYLLDPTGAVLGSAWPRTAARLELPPGALERLLMARGTETLVARSEAEGGQVLAVVRPLLGGEAARFGTVLFSPELLKGRIRLLKEGGETEAEVFDAAGRTLVGLPAGVDAIPLVAETALSNHPLSVRLRRDIGPAVAEWRIRLAWQTGLGLVLLLAAGALSVVALSARRRARIAAGLKEEIREKELLFHEINHRVKNNLAIVQSILSLGAGEIESRPEEASEILRAASERIQSMTMLHEQLYMRRSLGAIDLGMYLSDLAGRIAESYSVGERVSVEVEVEAVEGIVVDLGTAVPLAIIVTELVSNALKHAFPGDRRGRVVVAASPAAGRAIRVEVRDDGVGAEAGQGAQGFGHVLVEALAEQLGARLAREPRSPGAGLGWSLEFVPAERTE
jgi:two-component sensor histidine kinase